MWKRDQAAKPTTGQPTAPPVPGPQVVTPPIAPAATPVTATAPAQGNGKSETHMVNIGKSVVIKGELRGSEDLTIEGRVDGTIELRDNVLTIGPNGRIKAQVFAKTVVIVGTVNGNVTASEKVEIRDGASVDGDVVSPKVAIAEGARFHGSVDMQQGAKRSHAANLASVAATTPTPEPPAAAASTH